jgi:hypothetical protein
MLMFCLLFTIFYNKLECLSRCDGGMPRNKMALAKMAPVQDAAMQYKYILCRQSICLQVLISAQMTRCRNVLKRDIMTLENKQSKYGVRLGLAALVSKL